MSQPPPKRLVFAGEAIVDVLMWVPALPERGGDMLAESAAVEVGGGFNIMAAAVRQGLPVVYAGGHGTGPWGDKVRAALAGEGIRLLRDPDPDADTGFDVALVEAGGERTFVTTLGAESLRGPGAWDLVRVRPGDAVLRVRLRPGRARVGPGPRCLGGWPARRSPAVHRSRAAGRGHPRDGARPGAGPLRLVELQPARGRPAHRQRRPGGGGPPPGPPDRPGRRHRAGRPGRLRDGHAGARRWRQI